MKLTRVEKDLDSPRIQFNWGYHDARWAKAHASQYQTKYLNKYYAHGYRLGWQSLSEEDQSQPVWDREYGKWNGRAQR